MSATKRKAATLRPFPKAGDFVLIGHGIWSEPDQWWISECEWSDGEQFLVRHTLGWHPTHDPYLGTGSAIIAIGTREQCDEIAKAARAIRHQHIEAFREANVALQRIKDECVGAIVEAVAALDGGIQASGRIA